ncbi:RNA-directed DNA polymerase, eukaryota, reverse transcriptase zinc-binding domain protein [Tanacetum coccineum]
MFVLARRHKEMKKHMRELNWSNGNVFEKVKKLKVELKKVQQDHDKDPHNARLREEEMIYTNVYKESVLDEEKVLKQKTKVECLREGDHNTAYFHKKLKGRFYKSRIVTIKDEMSRAFYGDDVPAQFLDDVDALKVIKRITDEEIKAALFEIDGELNITLISLVPKTKTPMKVSDYRPIASCNVVYKCISKVIAIRIEGVLNTLVHSNQSNFIGDKKISDNILLAEELMCVYNWKNKANKCAFKVDIQKAYDAVNWDFFIKSWLTGLWFIKVEKKFKYHWGCKKFRITSLCFFDDLLLFFHEDLLSTSVLRKTMDELSLSSGLLPSMAKSTIFFGNVPEMVKENIKLVMPFSECHLPVRYLGIPLVSRNLTRGDCTILIEIVKKRIDDWRNKSLSFVGRLQLIAFILNFLHVYWAYMFILTINVCNDIEKLVKGFLWKTNGNNRGKGSVSWKDVCL